MHATTHGPQASKLAWGPCDLRWVLFTASSISVLGVSLCSGLGTWMRDCSSVYSGVSFQLNLSEHHLKNQSKVCDSTTHAYILHTHGKRSKSLILNQSHVIRAYVSCFKEKHSSMDPLFLSTLSFFFSLFGDRLAVIHTSNQLFNLTIWKCLSPKRQDRVIERLQYFPLASNN